MNDKHNMKKMKKRGLAAFGVLRRLPEKIFAAGELPVKLVIQIVAVGDDNDGRAF